MADHLTTSAYYAARPIVSIEGRDEVGLTDGLLSFLVEETTEGHYRAELSFGNWGTADDGSVGYLYFDRSILDFGKRLQLRIGDGDAASNVFEGQIMGIEASYLQRRTPEIAVLAEDRLQDLRMTRRTRSFELVTDADVMRQVAAQHGLRSRIAVEGPLIHRVLTQVNQSDLAFLRDRARAIDAELWIEEGALNVQSRSSRRHEDVSLTYGQRLIELSVLADLSRQRTSLVVTGWDVAVKDAIEAEAGESAILGELNGDVSGASLLASAVSERKEQLVHTLPLNQAEARHTAEAHFRAACRRFVNGTGMAEGDGRIRVGSYVDLSGLGPLFNGKYYVAEARHTFDASNGYRTRFCVERAGLGR